MRLSMLVGRTYDLVFHHPLAAGGIAAAAALLSLLLTRTSDPI